MVEESSRFPAIAVVVIGLNVEKYIERALESIRVQNYPQARIEIVYVDGGSNDQSVNFASQIPNVQVLSLRRECPTPGSGRNEALAYCSADYIQFMDADTLLDPDWLRRAVKKLQDPSVAAVCGRRQELYPSRSLFHFIADTEWNAPAGDTAAFGGDVLIRRSVLLEVGGYDSELVAGEDPDLSYRIRQRGYRLLALDLPMTAHDLNMYSIKQYWKRSYRTGHAYAEVALRHLGDRERFWSRELLRILLRGLAPGIFLLTAWSLALTQLGLFFALVLVFWPFRKFAAFVDEEEMTLVQAFTYCMHLTVVVYPQCFGVFRYLRTLLGARPLVNFLPARRIAGIQRKS